MNEFLPLEIGIIFKAGPVVNSILESSGRSDTFRLGEINPSRDLQEGHHIILNAEFANVLKVTLPGKGIGSNVEQRSISSRNNATDVVGREFRIERLDDLVASLLAGNSVGATVNLAKNTLSELRSSSVRGTREIRRPVRSWQSGSFLAGVCAGLSSSLVSSVSADVIFVARRDFTSSLSSSPGLSFIADASFLRRAAQSSGGTLSRKYKNSISSSTVIGVRQLASVSDTGDSPDIRGKVQPSYRCLGRAKNS